MNDKHPPQLQSKPECVLDGPKKSQSQQQNDSCSSAKNSAMYSNKEEQQAHKNQNWSVISSSRWRSQDSNFQGPSVQSNIESPTNQFMNQNKNDKGPNKSHRSQNNEQIERNRIMEVTQNEPATREHQRKYSENSTKTLVRKSQEEFEMNNQRLSKVRKPLITQKQIQEFLNKQFKEEKDSRYQLIDQAMIEKRYPYFKCASSDHRRILDHSYRPLSTTQLTIEINEWNLLMVLDLTGALYCKDPVQSKLQLMSLCDQPKKVFPDLECLIIAQNKLTELSFKQFLKFPKLRCLVIRSKEQQNSEYTNRLTEETYRMLCIFQQQKKSNIQIVYDQIKRTTETTQVLSEQNFSQ